MAVPDGAKFISVQSVGRSDELVPIIGETVNVTLNSKDSELDSVVVTAIGIKRQNRSLGYSVQVLNADKFENARSTNIADAIAGQSAGVRVNNQSGGLGGSSKVVIRGSSSLSGSSQPLYVIDGVPVQNTSFTTGTTGNVDYGSGINDLNPDDIASMSILKGPAATAQYGSLAKDGAIIITTKKGTKGRTQVSINSSARWDNPMKLPDFQSEYAQGSYGKYNLRYTNGWGPKISDVQNQTFTDFLGRNVTLTAHPDNIKDFFVTGHTYLNSIALSGADEKTDYRIGFTSTNQTGIVPEQKLNKYNIAANIGHKFNDKLSSRITVNYAQNNVFGRPFQSSNNPNVLNSSIYSIPTTVDINDLKNNYQDSLGNQIFLSTDKNGNNPYWITYKNPSNSKVNRFFGSANLEYKPIKGLSISDNLGYDMSNQTQHAHNRQGTAGDLLGSYEDYSIFQRLINNDLIATYQTNITEDYTLKVLAGNNILDRSNNSTDIIAKNLIVDNFFRPNNAGTVTTTENFNQRRLVSYYGEISASYKNIAYLTLTGRNDHSSTLPKNNRSYFYPSVSGSFVFTELMKNKDVLNFGKLRLSYAKVGSDADAYQLQTLYTAASTYFVQFSLPGTFPFLGQQGFTGPTRLANANLKPQMANSYEIGTNLSFLGSRINVDLTYYNTKTKDQILNLTIPASTGYRSQTINAGSITNKGLEAILDFQIFKPASRGDFGWNLTANLSHNKQVVNELAEGLTTYSIASGWSNLSIKAVPGKPFALYGNKWRRSPDGQFVINPANGLRLFDTDQYLGDVNPKFLLGFNNSFSYQGFTLGFLIDIRQGGVFYSGTVASLRSTGMVKETLENRDASFVDKGVNLVGSSYVTNTTPVQSMQDFWGTYSATSNTEGNVFDASYAKLRMVNFAYSFPKTILPKGISDLSLGVEGRNLWLIKSYAPHVDPEMNFFGNGSAGDGVEFNSFPTSRSFGVNLKVKF